jgi:basic membrane protein A and related proteins
VLTGSSQAVVGAIGVAKDKNVLWFGSQSEQTSLASGIVVATQVYDWTVALKDIIAKIKAGTMGGEAYSLTLDNKGMKIVYNPAYSLPADVKTAADDAIKGIIDGSITIKAAAASQ